MSILKITSDNPKLSYILAKNPETIRASNTPFKRSVRKGQVYGWFSENDQTFSLFFVDSPAENSFSDSQFEYLDKSRYSSPYAPIAIMAQTLTTALAKPNELDIEGYETKVSSTIKVPARIISRFEKMKGLILEAVEIAPGHHKVSLATNGVLKALNLFQTLCFVACMADDDTYVPLTEEGLLKFVKGLNRVDAPYYLRYLVSSRAINNRDVFGRMKEHLDTDTINMKFGDTQTQRHDAIKAQLLGGEKLVDIGCGEMFHALRLSKVYETVYAIDADEEIFKANSGKVIRRKLDDKIIPMLTNVTAPNWVEENESLLDDADVLLGECIEHMPKILAFNLILNLLLSGAKRIIITVPNKSFNVNYGMADDEFRHPDHLWEPTSKEWIEFIQNVKESVSDILVKRNFYTSQVGDIVGMEGMCHMAVFEANTA